MDVVNIGVISRLMSYKHDILQTDGILHDVTPRCARKKVKRLIPME